MDMLRTGPKISVWVSSLDAGTSSRIVRLTKVRILFGLDALQKSPNMIRKLVKPTILDDVPASSELTHTEIFGPVLSMVHAKDLDEAMELLGKSHSAIQASLFTSSGSAARRFRYEAPAGNVGINIGVAAPMAYFPFSGWKDSFFGVMHGQGRDAVEFLYREESCR